MIPTWEKKALDSVITILLFPIVFILYLLGSLLGLTKK